MSLLQAHCDAELDAAKARNQAELEALQARLKMLRMRQSRVMAFVDDVFLSEEQEQRQHEREEDLQQQQQHRERLLLLQERDQSPRWARDSEQITGGTSVAAGQLRQGHKGRRACAQRGGAASSGRGDIEGLESEVVVGEEGTETEEGQAAKEERGGVGWRLAGCGLVDVGGGATVDNGAGGGVYREASRRSVRWLDAQ